MSVSWGFYSIALAFAMLFWPPILIGALVGGACIFVVSGYAARFITFRIIPTLMALAFAVIVCFYVGFAITEPTLEGCLPL